MNKKKTTTAIVAGVTAVALLLGGTFAWTSISQRALNEAAGIVNVGGRLHDDFNGENKDIYVENFTDPLDGGQPIYARIRLDEYMEVGSEAGKYDADSDSYVVDRNAKPVVDGTDIAEVSTWTTHVPTESCTVCATSDSCAIHDHWTWTMGNDDAKYFMPTFNKDKDSLDADINGTYHGKDDKDKIYYDDYVEYKENETKKDVAYYDDDTDTEDNNGTRQVEETHTAKLTGTAQVVTMDYWVNTLQGVAGNFWVYDTDGWAYWANPIMPGESTGFLLDGIKMTKNPGEKCYYAINVVAQFATVNDWELFGVDAEDPDYPSDDALTLLAKASQNVPVMTLNIEGNSNDINYIAGDVVRFEASVSINGTPVEDAGTITYSLVDAENLKSTIEGNTLTVGKEATGTVLTVIATAENYPGVVAMKSIKYAGATEFNFTYDGRREFAYMLYGPGDTIQLELEISDPQRKL